MANKRVKYFDIDDREEHLSFGTYALMMYYAKQLNDVEGKKLFDATLTENDYRRYYILGNDESYDSEIAHFSANDLQSALNFIDGQVIPALNNEHGDILSKFGGRESFYNLFYVDASYIRLIEVYSDEFYDSDPKQIAFLFDLLKKIFQYSLTLNQPLNVSVR